jgi:hypothetical protein
LNCNHQFVAHKIAVFIRLVNHASELIHQVYQREKVEDVAQWRDAVNFPQANPAAAAA